jgi:hypothetical protein
MRTTTGVPLSMGLHAPTSCIWKHHSERWRFNVVGRSFQIILDAEVVAKYWKEDWDTFLLKKWRAREDTISPARQRLRSWGATPHDEAEGGP